MPRKLPKLQVTERKLGRELACGMAWMEAGIGRVEIDPRLDSKEYLDTLIHEMLHILLPHWSEKRVASTAAWMTRALWRRGFRRIKP